MARASPESSVPQDPENRRTSSRFRDWLVDKVSRSRWPYYKDQTEEEIAKKLGITLDVLHDAQRKLEERTKKDALMPGQKLGFRTQFRLPQDGCISLEPPKEIYEEWCLLRDRMRSSDAIILRTVIHAVLQMPEQPRWLSGHKRNAWIWQGHWYGQENIRSHPYRLRAKVSEGAYQALLRRAENTDCRPSAIARWGVVLFVHGKLPRFSIVSVPHAMYKDTSEYCLMPKITELSGSPAGVSSRRK